MTVLILFLLLATALAVETVRRTRHDGPGPSRPPASRFEDPQFRSPARG
ncbi:hypothetical protein QWY28_09155 [Nocardioides sp. SOB77]|uniref:Uncharacterized protein n=1 Tax=Nocardioides oceani TaxID=3058369 RepID=A0ABT8FEK6_9ACTN|nr:hypothetical protein [Nocardioides oceani]MDN4173107.1 hypothetical protein [Nocardioides oceani]